MNKLSKLVKRKKERKKDRCQSLMDQSRCQLLRQSIIYIYTPIKVLTVISVLGYQTWKRSTSQNLNEAFKGYKPKFS